MEGIGRERKQEEEERGGEWKEAGGARFRA